MDTNSSHVIKGYQLLELIGEGGFGLVYRAYQPTIEREVAIKAILPIHANQPNFIRRFEVEAQLIARLEHPHIVPLYDYWRDPDGAYLVMRWLRGGNLAEAVKKGPWPAEEVAKVLDQLTGALTVAHRNNIVHQDIKPANILLDEDGNVYLTDFGIAKNIINPGQILTEDEEDTLQGSPAYVSPEQIRRRPITPQTDIYSLGLVIFELLTGHEPFEATNVMEVLKLQATAKLPPLQDFNPDLPNSLNAIIWRATSKEPDLRYPNVITMAEDFRRAVLRSRGAQVPTDVPASGRTFVSDETMASILSLPVKPPNPYKGLRPFQEADASDFFGREGLVEHLLKRMGQRVPDGRFLAIVGPSGSGKSSVVKAGLIPAIRRGDFPGWEKWFIVEMTPGPTPFKQLEATLMKISTQSATKLFDQLYDDNAGLLQAVERVLPEDDTELILFIDQFEELFTLVEYEATRAHFLTNLVNAVMAPNSRLRVLATLRADFYDRPLLYPQFGDLVRSRTEVVLPLAGKELERAITGPAERVGLVIEPSLVEVIVEDVTTQPSSLPLLQYALTELYEHRAGLQLTLDAYKQSGGVSGALARRADEIYKALNKYQKEATRQLFLRMIALGEGTEDTRRRALQAELPLIEGDKNAMRQVIDTYGKYRLLAFDHEPATRAPTVEVAHEALIKRWDQLREWLNSSRDDLRAQQRLSVATAEWLRAKRDRSFLATGARLVQFEALVKSTSLALNQDERAYVKSSMALRQRAIRRLQLFAVALAAISIIAIIAAIFAFQQRNQAEDARQLAINERDRADQQAQTSRSRELAASALIQIDRLDLPLLLSVEALNAADTFEARNSLLTVLQSQSRLDAFLHGHTDSVRAVTYSPDGTLAASAGRDNTIILWDMNTDQPIGVPLTGHTDWINAVAFSPDGTLLISASEDGTVRVWDVSTHELVGDPLSNQAGSVRSVAISPDGQMLAAAGADTIIHLWDMTTREPIGEGLTGHTDLIYAVAFSPDGTVLASGSADNTVRLWDIRDLESTTSRTLEGHQNWVLTLAFSPDGTVLASGSADTTIRLWDVESGEQIGRTLSTPGAADWVQSVAFSPNGTRLVSGGRDSRILFWDLATGRAVDGVFNSQRAPVSAVAVSPDGTRLLTGGDSNDVLLWKLDNALRLGQVLSAHREQVLSVAFNSDGTQMASAGGLESNGEDFSIRLWNVADASLQTELSGHNDSVTSVAFSPVAPQLASGSLDATVIVWDLTTGESLGTIQDVDSVFSIAYSPDGRLIAIGDNDGLITLWDVSGGAGTWSQVGQTLRGHTDRITSLAFSPDGTLLVSGSRDATVRVWDVASGQQRGEPLTGHSDGIMAVAFSTDGRFIASGSRDFTVRLWNAATGEPVGDPLIGHTNWVNGLAFANESGRQVLASTDTDGKIILWDVELGRQLGLPFVGHSGSVNAVAFSPDGQYMVSGGRDTLVILWKTSLPLWRERACSIANRNINSEEAQLYFQGLTIPETCP